MEGLCHDDGYVVGDGSHRARAAPAADDGDVADALHGFCDFGGDFREDLDDHLRHGGFAVFLEGFGFAIHGGGFGFAFCLDRGGFGFPLCLDSGSFLLRGIASGGSAGFLRFGGALLFVEGGFGFALALGEVGGSFLLNGVFLGVGLFLNLRGEFLLADGDFLPFQFLIAFRLCDLGVDGCGLDGFLLLLRLDFVGGVGFGALDVRGFLQLRLPDGEIGVALGNL